MKAQIMSEITFVYLKAYVLIYIHRVRFCTQLSQLQFLDSTLEVVNQLPFEWK